MVVCMGVVVVVVDWLVVDTCVVGPAVDIFVVVVI